MGGVTSNLLPGDSELARRAAGGDGAAFVRLFDHYSAEVFEAVLAATESVERAADATQVAFLRLLRRPPAIDAPDTDVADRLRVLALGAGTEGSAYSRRTPEGGHAPADAGVGWLRSETVAKAGAHFDSDWSLHLAQQTPALSSAVEAARRWEAASAVMPADRAPEPVAATTTEDVPEPRRRLRPALALPRIPVPSMAAVAAMLVLLAFAVALGAIAMSGGDDGGGGEESAQANAIDVPAKARSQTAGATTARAGAGSRKERGERRSGRRAARGGAVNRMAENDEGSAGTRAVRLTGTRGAPRSTRLSGRAPTAPNAGRTGDGRLRRIGSQSPSRDGSDPAPTATPDAAPQPEPAPAPQQAPAPSQPAPEPAPTRERPPTAQGTPNGGANRNCNSKKSSDPC